jgi:hypothetical protein
MGGFLALNDTLRTPPFVGQFMAEGSHRHAVDFDGFNAVVAELVGKPASGAS